MKKRVGAFSSIEPYELLSAHKQLGINIRVVRRIRSISQEKLGLAVGLTRTTIGKIEVGSRRVEALELVGIANALNVKLEELIPS